MKKIMLLLTIGCFFNAPAYADTSCQDAVDALLAATKEIYASFQTGREAAVDIAWLSERVNAEIAQCSPERAEQFRGALEELSSLAIQS